MGPDPAPFLVTFPGLLRNVLPIEQAAAGRGLFSIKPERDGIIRRVPVIMEAQDALVPSLAMEMLRVVTGASAILVRVDAAGVQAVVGARPRRCRPTVTASSGCISTRSIRRVTSRPRTCCKAQLPRDRLRGRLVLIGTSAIGLLDIKTTPVEAAMPGVEVHAQMLESVLTKAQSVARAGCASAPKSSSRCCSASPSSSPRRCCRRPSSSGSARC